MLAAQDVYRSVSEIQKAVQDGTTTVTGLVKHYLREIEASNPELNAVTVLNDHVLEDAKKLDVRPG